MWQERGRSIHYATALLERKGNGFWLINSMKLTLTLKPYLGVDIISSLLQVVEEIYFNPGFAFGVQCMHLMAIIWLTLTFIYHKFFAGDLGSASIVAP